MRWTNTHSLTIQWLLFFINFPHYLKGWMKEGKVKVFHAVSRLQRISHIIVSSAKRLSQHAWSTNTIHK